MRMKTQKLARRLIFNLSEGRKAHRYGIKGMRAWSYRIFMSTDIFVLNFSFIEKKRSFCLYAI